MHWRCARNRQWDYARPIYEPPCRESMSIIET
jgi:hypothetical protein